MRDHTTAGRLVIRALIAAGLLMLGGCADMGPVMQALANDQNAVCLKITSVWASSTLDRNWGCEMPEMGQAGK